MLQVMYRSAVRHIAPALFLIAAIGPASTAPGQGHVAQNSQPMKTSVPPSVEQPIITHLRVTGSIPVNPGRTAEDVLRDFTDLFTAANYRGAALLAEELIRVAPDVPQGYYNLCCAHSRLREIDAALDAFDLAIAHGWRAVEHTAVDADLEPLRSHQRFRDLVARMKELREREQIEAIALRDDPPAAMIERLNNEVPALLRRYNVPGVAIAIVDGSDIVCSAGFGTTLAGSAQSIAPESKFRLQRPIDLLVLIGAAQQQRQDLLQVQALLAQADEIGLRGQSVAVENRRSPHRPARRRTATSTLASHQAPSATGDSHRAPTVDWQGQGIVRGTAELMTLAIELTGEQPFHRYCQNSIFDAAGMASSSIISRATLRQARFRNRPADESTSCAAIVAGHSRLGTPMPVLQPSEKDDPTLVTTANDLAALLVAMQSGDTSVRDLPLAEIAASARLTPNGLGLGVDIRRTPDGLRVQLAERGKGVGCLVRWYPGAQRGIVILFNSDNGPSVAERIAHLAIGGH